YGLVSRFGLIAMASSLDQIGPFTRDVADAAELLNVIAGHDPKDSTSAPGRAPDFTAALKAEAKGLRIGLPKAYFTEGISAEVQAAVRQAAAELERAGATVEEVSLPHAEYALGAYYMIVSAESSSNLGRYDGVRYGRREAGADVPAMMTATRALLGPEVKRRIVLGTFVRGKERLPEYYMRAARVRTLLRREFEQAFEKVDVLLTPVTPTTAFPLGRRVRSQMEAYAADICTVAVNLAGLPALSMPCGVGADGLPIGLQFIGPAFGDAQVLQAAYTYEQLAWPEGAGRAWRAGRGVGVAGRGDDGEAGGRIRGRHRAGNPRGAADRRERMVRLQHQVRRGAQHAGVPGVHGAAGNAAGAEQRGGGVRDQSRPGADLQHRARGPLRPEALFLPGL